MGIPEPLDDGRRRSIRTCCSCRSPASIGAATAIGYGAGYYDRSLARLRESKPIRAVGVAYGVCEVAAVPYEAHDQSLDVVVTEHETIYVSER